MKRNLLAVAISCWMIAGCGPSFKSGDPHPLPPSPPSNSTPHGAAARLLYMYESKRAAEYWGMFTGDFTFEFSSNTDPTLVQQYSTGWFKNDERESSAHLFGGYTPPGGQPLPAATTIDINLAVDQPTDDNTSGTDPKTHKVLATRVDGSVTVPEQGTEPLTFTIVNNYNIFYLVRGDVAVNLDTNQPADSTHWYIYRWVDLSQATPSPAKGPMAAQSATWGRVKALYR